MKLRGTNWRLWLLITVCWMLIGLAYTFNYYHFAPNYVKIFDDKELTFWKMFVWEMPYWILWIVLSPMIFWLTRRFRLEREHLLRNALIHVTSFLTLCLAHRAIYLLIDWGISVKAYTALGSLSAVYDENFFFNLPNGFLCYITILLAGTYYRHHQEEEEKNSRLEAERAQAQWKAWKDQLQHHFLFNTLNSISAEMDEDVEVAEEMLARLGDFLRMTLDNSGAQEVTLQDEMEFMRCYLEIERARLDRLTVEIELAPETHEALVPNLILQPIIENAIRHGITARGGEGRIEIRSRRENGWLRLEVEDDGPGLHLGGDAGLKPRRGLGFDLARERLKCLYGTRARLLPSNAPGGGLRVALELPYRLSSAANPGDFDPAGEEGRPHDG